LALTLSPTPRKFTIAIRVMNASATSVILTPSPKSRSKASPRFAANALDAVDAEVMPEDITANATMNVRKWTPNALCV
jgi:hypothetical protein